MNLATTNEYVQEIARLHAEVERLRSRPCPHVTGSVTQYCTLTPFTLTDAERAAVEWCVEMAVLRATECDEEIATLRGLLERTK